MENTGSGADRFEGLTLGNLADGFAADRFAAALAAVSADFEDGDKAPDGKRSIVLRVDFKPSGDPANPVPYSVRIDTKLAPAAGCLSLADRDERGKFVRYKGRQDALPFEDETGRGETLPLRARFGDFAEGGSADGSA